MLNICKELFDSWNAEKIRYCHWKSNEHLMEGLDGDTDLDVFVMPDDKELAEKLLDEKKYIKFVPQKSARYPMVDEWIGFDYDTGRLVHVHLHYQIITGTKFNKEYVFPIDERIIATRISDADTRVFVASPDLEIIVLYARIALKSKNKKNIQPGKDAVKEIVYLKERIDSNKVLENCKAYFGDSAEKMFDYINKDKLDASEWYDLYKAVKAWLAPYRKHSALYVGIKYRYHHYRNIYMSVMRKKFGKHPISRKTLPEKGFSVCFIGADGSGKSTVSCEIQKWLNWKIEADRFYLGSGDHYNSLTKRLLIKIKSKKKPAASNEKSNDYAAENKPVSNAKKKVSLKQRVMRWGYKSLNAGYLKQIAVRSYKEVKKAQKYINKGAVALYDRFPQNQFPGLYDGPKIRSRGGEKLGIYEKMMASREERAIKKAQKYQPDLMFKLILSPEESVRRKPDHTIEEVAPKAMITPQLVFEKSHVYDIDATQPYEQELLQIKRLIWDEITNR